MHAHYLQRLLLLLAVTVTLSACGPDTEPDSASRQNTGSVDGRPTAAAREDLPAVPVPAFNSDSAYAYVAKQVAFGPRVMNTDAHDAAKDWMVGKLKSFGADVTEQDFTVAAYDGTALESTNIIARFNADMEYRILLAAHYDTRHVADSPLEDDPAAVVEGADDGASGVGVLLEIARQLSLSAPNIGVDIVLFDAEDYGESGGGDPNTWGLGAQHYSRNLPETTPAYGILLDMVGAKDARFAIEEVSQRYAPQIVSKVWNLASTISNYAAYFPKENGKGVTDDHYFVNTIARIPMIDIINYRKETQSGFVAHWHTDNDNMDVINKETLQAVGQVVTAVVYREGNGSI